MLFLTYGDTFQGFLGKEYVEVAYAFILLGASWDCAACPRLHRLAFLPGSTMGKLLYFGSVCQIPNSMRYPAHSFYVILF